MLTNGQCLLIDEINGWPALAAGFYEIEWDLRAIEVEGSYLTSECQTADIELLLLTVECWLNGAFIFKRNWMSLVLKRMYFIILFSLIAAYQKNI